MRPTKMSTADCQEAVFEVAFELARQDKRLAEIASELALPPDINLGVEIEIPPTTEIELFSRIAVVKTDYLQPAIRVVLTAAQLSDAVLRSDFLREAR